MRMLKDGPSSCPLSSPKVIWIEKRGEKEGGREA